MRPPEIRPELLARIASLYYEKDLDQKVIAKELGMSRSNVSRLLKEARARGIVQVRIQWPLGRHEEVEQRLQATFGLPQAIVLAGQGSGWDETESRVGQLAAQYLDSVLEPDTILGVSWGRAIHQLVRSFNGRKRPGVMVVQMMGGLGGCNPHIDGPDLARRLADAIGGSYRYLQAPLVVRDPSLKHALLQEASISETLDWAKALVTINAKNLDQKTLENTLSVLLKHESDLQRAKRWLQTPTTGRRLDDGDERRLSRWNN